MPKYHVKRHAIIQPLDSSYCYIALTKNQIAIVNKEDYPILSRYNWQTLRRRNGDFYAVRKSCAVYMHREVLRCRADEEIDHRNGDTLDNRRDNLRRATRETNQANRGRQRNNKSGFKGVSWSKGTKKWIVFLQTKKKKMYLGQFDSKILAAKTYDKAAQKYHKKFAVLNFAARRVP